jgi:hypothetical protein
MVGGVYRVYRTATSPFEEFLGTIVVVIFAMMWAMCFGVFASHWRKSGNA